MKCASCSFEGQITEFRYLYNPRIDASLAVRQCPKCQQWIGVDQMKQEATQVIKAGSSPWGKSAGIEGVSPASD